MSPRKTDADSRTALIETAARLIAHGRSPTARMLAAERGTSTMAVYTHFKGMEPLREAVRREGFARLRDRLGSLTSTDDPVTDVSIHGLVYIMIGIANPDLYRTMFLEAPIDPGDAVVQSATLEPVTAAVRRCIQAGRFDEAAPEMLALQLWIATHGVVTLAVADAFPKTRFLDYMSEMAINLYVGFGDTRRSASRSIDHAKERFNDLGLDYNLV